MERSSDIDNFLHNCETLVSRAQATIESAKEFEEITRELEEFVGTNWVDFSALITKFKDENKLDESFKKRLNTLLTLLSSLENKAHTKNDWVNEFKQYIINANQ